MLDTEKIRADFSVLSQSVQGCRLAYLDNAASTQKPRQVIEALKQIYTVDYSNIHRGVHTLSMRATEAYETARETVRAFLNAPTENEVIFVRGVTEGINLVAQTFGRSSIGAGDEILISCLEHHSNIVPWQMLCEERGASLKVIDIDEDGGLRMDDFNEKLSERTKLVAIGHVSNALGTVNPIKRIIDTAHHNGIPVLIDGAQSAPHMPIDVQALDCDFYVFSAHKIYGPTGVGVLYGRRELLESMPPWHGGGDMIERVTFEKTTYADLPSKFEAGTPHIAGAIGLAAALDYVSALGLDNIWKHEESLLAYGTSALEAIEGLRIIGTAEQKTGVLSFVMDCAHPHDIATILDHKGIAVRAGHHCAQPLMDRLGISSTARASFGIYNSYDDIDQLIDGLGSVRELFG
jgi:cysteine desulfurase/selenocysteine lyase